MSSVWGMILQWGSSIKLSIELPVATRHRRDMTAEWLKEMLNPNKQQQQLPLYRRKAFHLQSHLEKSLDEQLLKRQLQLFW